MDDTKKKRNNSKSQGTALSVCDPRRRIIIYRYNIRTSKNRYSPVRVLTNLIRPRTGLCRTRAPVFTVRGRRHPRAFIRFPIAARPCGFLSVISCDLFLFRICLLIKGTPVTIVPRAFLRGRYLFYALIVFYIR